MDHSKFAEINREMLTTMHNMFLTGMGALTVMQDQAEKMMRMMQTKHQDAYEQSSKVMEEWLTTLRKGQDEFRKLVDENFKKAEGYLKTLGPEGM